MKTPASERIIQQAWRQSGLEFILGLTILCVTLLTSTAHGQLVYEYGGSTEVVEAVQLWYDGYWKEIGWLNGTMAWWPANSAHGKIVLLRDFVAPHEKRLRQASEAGAIGAIVLRPSDNDIQPGYDMYLVDGSDRRRITIPVLQVIHGKRGGPNLKLLADGSWISVRPSHPNRFKQIYDTPAQAVLNVVLSLWEIAIIGIGVLRMSQLYNSDPIAFRFYQPGFLCVSLEVIGAMIRLAYTCVDPFLSFRIIPYHPSLVLLTLSCPITLSAGILLTFFWAEVLTRNKIKVVPFISSFKTAAICVVVGIIFLEIIVSILRVQLDDHRLALSPNYISVGAYFIIAIILTVCYLVCAIKIAIRIGALPGTGKGRAIRVMAIRAGVASVGYLLFLASLIIYAIAAERPWGRITAFNMMFAGMNWVGLLQVLATKPSRKQHHPTQSPRDIGLSVSSNRGSSQWELVTTPRDEEIGGSPDTFRLARGKSEASLQM